ncbi:MAG: hypothetical protein HY727_15705 [Candidatus Rokubacteria bacterium]|nr:hypothetical protein [Candidatus Rokubacteria bacterium]
MTVIQTPTHEQYGTTLQWLGGRFNPEKFNPKSVKFDDPTRRYELAFEAPFRRMRARATTRRSRSSRGSGADRRRSPDGRRCGRRGAAAGSP